MQCKLPEIHPFIAIPESEILLYARLKGLCTGTGKGVGAAERTFRGDAGCLLDRYTMNHPSAKFSLLHLAEEIGECLEHNWTEQHAE
jgi:tRNA(Ile)-lysidine synthase TilS/MesJ